jgi:hypothetical protein
MELKFRKIFDRPKEGFPIISIIAYTKIPWLKKRDPILPLATKMNQIKFIEKEFYIAQYKKILFIDLWLFTLRFEWLTKIKNYE